MNIRYTRVDSHHSETYQRTRNKFSSDGSEKKCPKEILLPK